MPRVPRYQQQVSPSRLPTPSVRLDPGASIAPDALAAGQVGQGLQRVANATGQAQERMQAARDRADKTLLLEREAEFERSINESLYTGPDAFMMTAGRTSAEREKSALELLEKRRGELGEGLSEQASQAWRLRTGSKLQDIRRRTATHVHQQLGVAREAAARLQEQEGLKAIANVWSDPEAFEVQRALMISAAGAAEDVGEAKALRVRQVAAKVEATAIQAALAADNVEWAEQRLAQHGEALPPQVLEPLRRTIETKKADQAADAKISSIVLGAVDERTGWVNEAAVWAEVDKAPADERDALRQRAVQRLQEASRARGAEVEVVYSRAFTGYLDGGARGIASEDKAWLIRRAPAEWRRLQQMMRQDARAHEEARNRRERRERGDSPGITEQMRLAEVEIRAQIQADPEGWAQRPVQDILEVAEELGVTLAPSQVKALGTVYASARGRTAMAERKGMTVSNREWNDRVSADIQSLGITKKSDQAKVRGFLNERRNKHLDENGGKEPSREDVARWRVEAFTQYDGGFWGAKRFGFERPADATDAPLSVDRQPYAPARNALGADETIIEEGLDLREGAETGSFALEEDAPRNATNEAANVDPEREAARTYLRGRGRQGTPEEVDALLDAARQRAGGVTSGAGERQR